MPPSHPSPPHSQLGPETGPASCFADSCLAPVAAAAAAAAAAGVAAAVAAAAAAAAAGRRAGLASAKRNVLQRDSLEIIG